MSHLELPRSLDWIERLVRFDTTSRESNLGLIETVRDHLSAAGYAPLLIYDASGKKANLFVTVPAHDGETQGGVVLSGHTDVVPVDGQAWSSDPFQPALRDGRLYGRGTCDMKGFLGVALAMLPTFASTRLRAPLHLALSYDEEVGCLGADVMLRELARLDIRPDSCIVGEPTEMRVISAHKSSNLYRCTVHGHAAHSSLTPRGVNAIEYAARAICHIRDMADGHRIDGPFDRDFEVPFTTANTGIISGGLSVNTIPDHCQFDFEFRTIPGVLAPDVIGGLRRYITGELRYRMKAEHPQADIVLETLAEVPGFDTAAHAEIAQLAQALTGARGTQKVAYCTEAGMFQRAGMTAVICGPGSLEQAHRADEYVAVAQIHQCEQFMEKLANHLAVAGQ
ncbi:acetylornithine deacetylase [Paraburkholderia domus]|uniref:acetylornithine deacetylase n=1 Tax=Paraburkholderia domus TaxID=2793075 RepID=UPI001B1A9061|nr:acetylornithine deacetylase [Paraburkholderia domus]CAE6820922.1 Acetylornithine deacetylase [Paraburkholderia domus]